MNNKSVSIVYSVSYWDFKQDKRITNLFTDIEIAKTYLNGLKKDWANVREIWWKVLKTVTTEKLEVIRVQYEK